MLATCCFQMDSFGAMSSTGFEMDIYQLEPTIQELVTEDGLTQVYSILDNMEHSSQDEPKFDEENENKFVQKIFEPTKPNIS